MLMSPIYVGMYFKARRERMVYYALRLLAPAGITGPQAVHVLYDEEDAGVLSPTDIMRATKLEILAEKLRRSLMQQYGEALGPWDRHIVEEHAPASLTEERLLNDLIHRYTDADIALAPPA